MAMATLTRVLCLALSMALVTAPGMAQAPATVALPGATAAAPTWLPAADGTPVTGRQTQLNSVGYTEQEWVLRGQARTYSREGSWGDDGHWLLSPRDAARPYETRLLVRRPLDAARFNGIVLVEWLNTSLGFDLDGGWILNRDEILREGYAWVGVSAEARSTKALQKMNPARYAQAHIADNDMSFDVFSDAAQAVRQAAAQWGTPQAKPAKLLAFGYSKSASYLFTYMNAFQPLNHAFDGYYMRGATPAAIQVNDYGLNIIAPKIRTDLDVPLMQVQTEMEVAVSWPLSHTVDTDKVRYWEIAGAVHFDRRIQEETPLVGHDDVKAIAPECLHPTNALPAHMVDDAALHALRTWITAGTSPPKAPRMQRGGMGFVQDDAQGNGMGGLRLPEMLAPLARYGLYNNFPTNSLSLWAGFYCIAGGSVKPLEAAALQARYGSDQGYQQAYKQAADKLMYEGFLRPADHLQLMQQAKSLRLPR
jgi:hypothetical protein